jgi:hypothetical protein
MCDVWGISGRWLFAVPFCQVRLGRRNCFTCTMVCCEIEMFSWMVCQDVTCEISWDGGLDVWSFDEMYSHTKMSICLHCRTSIFFFAGLSDV